MWAALEKVAEVAVEAAKEVGTAATEAAEKVGANAAEGAEVAQKIEGASIGEQTTVLKPNFDVIKGKSLESLVQRNFEKSQANTSEVDASDATETKKSTLTEEEKARIKEETGWSDEIIDAIESMDQYEVYKNADLHEAEVNGRKCLLKDIDLDYVDPKTGKTNRELMAEGKSPIDSKTGEKIELHHMGQNFDGPFAELTENSEHGDGNHKTLHTSNEGSWRNDPEQKNQYQREKAQHWKTRAQGEV